MRRHIPEQTETGLLAARRASLEEDLNGQGGNVPCSSGAHNRPDTYLVPKRAT